MSVQSLRNQVLSLAGSSPSLLCITGASGAGKTTVLDALRAQIDAKHLPTLGFDSLGVPSAEHMIAGWESGRGWQKAMTWHWVQTVKNVFRTHPLVVLEGSFDPQYAIAACSANRLRLAVILLHTEADVRAARLAKRGQPELATDEMTSWARYLEETTRQLGGHVIDAARDVNLIVDEIAARGVALLAEAPPPATERPRRSN